MVAILAVVCVAVAAAAWYVVRPEAYLPHERVVLSLPFEASDPPDGLIPMGETLYHPKPGTPHGHPGIDFGWQSGASHAMVAAASGVVAKVVVGASTPGKVDVDVRHGVYLVRYWEMDDAANLSVGDAVEVGDVVGHAGRFCDEEHCWFNVHWELASISPIVDRWCPMAYFTHEARAGVEAVWAKVPGEDRVKSAFPDVCSGDYAGKDEFS